MQESLPLKHAHVGLLRRLASMLYESLLLFAILFAACFIFLLLFFFLGFSDHLHRPTARLLLQIYLLIVCGWYFVWCWTRGGQTLAMKTWRLKIVGNNGQKLSVRQAVARYVFSLFSLGLCFVGFVWALFDKEHQFLHDRLAGTRIIKQ